MKIKDIKQNLSRDSKRLIIMAFVFIFVYIFVIFDTYHRIEHIAKDALLKSAVSSATSFHKIIDKDMAQIQYAANEFARAYPATNKKDIAGLLDAFIDAQSETDNCERLMFVDMEGYYTYSDGVTGKMTRNEQIKNEVATISEPTLAELSTIDTLNRQVAYIYCPVFVDDAPIGLMVGTFDYNTVISETYPTEYYSEESINIITNSYGQIILNASDKTDMFIDKYNFFEFLKSYAESSYTFTETTDENANANVVEIVVRGEKYAVSVVNPHEDCPLYIVRIVPFDVLLAQIGNLPILMIVTSIFFFICIAIVVYRFYKTLSASTEKIRSISYVDPLTGTSNFAKFKEDAEEALQNSTREDYSLCCVDMVGFRYINDAFGYDIGDEILIEITKCIESLLNDDELFSRVDGDKYVILTKRNFGNVKTEPFLHKLTDKISTIEPLAKSRVRLEVQMGVYKIEYEDIKSLSINAMYDRCLVALNSIDHNYTDLAIYDSAAHDEEIQKKNIESRMHQALENDEFRVFIQPKYRTGNGKLSGGEALIRWVDEDQGLLPPIKFISIFEQNRFVHEIDLYVMDVVCRFIHTRLTNDLPVVPISLNISPVEISMPNFKESYITIKNKYDIPDGLIELEFTEGIFFENENYFRELITDFKNHGFRCSIDDFGSGYSSLNVLKSLPVDTLKLDRLFFKESANATRDRSIVRSVVAMARSLNVATVAEGVETLDTAEFLKLIGCTFIQGYLYSTPLPLTEFEEKLNTEDIDTSTDLDLDKFEAVPLDIPFSNSVDSSLNRTYSAICEINASGNIYHMYYPGDGDNRFSRIPERGFYSSLIEDLVPRIVHEKDIEKVVQTMNPINLHNHFKGNKELDLEYRQLCSDGSFSWFKIHIIKAGSDINNGQIYFAYFNHIDNYKETEEQLATIQTRFSSAYSAFNGVVLELDLSNGDMELLESHPTFQNIFNGVKNYNSFTEYIFKNLLHPDETEKFISKMSLKSLSDYFSVPGNTVFSLDLLAKSTVDATNYSYYKGTYSLQQRENKVLLTIENISDRKTEEAFTQLQKEITNIAFANTYHSYFHVCLTKDRFTLFPYDNGAHGSPSIIEGKYSLYLETTIKKNVKECDREIFGQIFSLDGLKSIYDANSSRPIQISYQRREDENSEYRWFEASIVAIPLDFGEDEHVFIFRRDIEDTKAMEKDFNKCAQRLSTSLTLYDYVYSVDIESEDVDIIGGLYSNTGLSELDSKCYNDITMSVKNSLIHEKDRPAFRRFTYLENLVEYFSANPTTITKYFASSSNDNQIVEVSILFDSRESSLTFFVRKLDKPETPDML